METNEMKKSQEKEEQDDVDFEKLFEDFEDNLHPDEYDWGEPKGREIL